MSSQSPSVDGFKTINKPKRRSLFRSFSESKKSVWSPTSSQGTVTSHEERDTRRSSSKQRAKLQRRPSTSRSRSSVKTEPGSFPSPLSAPAFQESKASLLSSGSGHHRDLRRLKRHEAIQSTPDLRLRPPFADSLNHLNKPRNVSREHFQRHGRSFTMTADQLERRKANMSKLMRHLGESRIPPELIMAPPQKEVRLEDPLFAPRAKSLDLRPLSGVFEDVTEPLTPKLTRARSLGFHKRGPQDAIDRDQSDDHHDLQRKIKRNRKMTKIFGPEVTRDLMTILAEERESRRATPMQSIAEPPTPIAEEPPVPRTDSRSEIVRLAYDETDDEEKPPAGSIPPTPTPDSPADDQQRRTQKLAKFFGVDQGDLSSTMTTPGSPETPQATVVPLTEIDVKITGRRFWGSPMKAELKNAHMADAIHQLRSLKAS